MLRPFAVAAIAIVALAGCASLHRMSPQGICEAAGQIRGTQAWRDCWHQRRDEALAGDLAIIGAVVGVQAQAQTQAQAQPQSRPNTLLEDRPQQRRCVYWTPQGQRVLEPVNGVCPARYGN